MELSRQKYWSGLPFPSSGDLPNPGIKPGSSTLRADYLPSEPPEESVNGKWKWKWKSLSRVQLFATPRTTQSMGILQARILEWVALPFSRGSSQPRDWTQVSHIAGRFFYQLGHKGSPRIPEWVAYPFSSGSFCPRNQAGVFCIAGGFFTNWPMREMATGGY